MKIVFISKLEEKSDDSLELELLVLLFCEELLNMLARVLNISGEMEGPELFSELFWMLLLFELLLLLVVLLELMLLVELALLVLHSVVLLELDSLDFPKIIHQIIEIESKQ